MHEIHLVKDLLVDLLRSAEKNNVKKITKIYISMGGLTEITPDTLHFHFEHASKGTIAEGAQIAIKESTVRELRLTSFDCD